MESCAVKQELWSEYDRAVADYILSVAEATRSIFDDHASEKAREARTYLNACRGAIARHCREHGCDPTHHRQGEPVPIYPALAYMPPSAQSADEPEAAITAA